MQEHNKASAWFDDVYKKHANEPHNIPWVRKYVNPLLRSYIEDMEDTKGKKALVIGCGLGDDAYALDVAGFDVLAIDVSQTALDLAKERFAHSTIVFKKQDIFDMPREYHEHFDFVFEALTIQSLPVEFREKMVQAVADTVAHGGHLLVVAHKKESGFDGPPWPLEKEELDFFKSHGLSEVEFEIHTQPSEISNTKFRVLYKK